MDNTENKTSNFTIVPNDNKELYTKNSAFNILRVYIVERVRSFEKQGLACYIKNEQWYYVWGKNKTEAKKRFNNIVSWLKIYEIFNS